MAKRNLEQQTLLEENRELSLRLDRYEQQLRRIEIINEVAESANSTTDPNQAIRDTLARICEDTGWPCAHAFSVQNTGNGPELVSSGVWHLSRKNCFDEFVHYTESLRLQPGQGLPGIVYRDQEALWANAVKSDEKRFAIGRKVGLQSTFGFPVMMGNEVIAVLEFFSERNVAPDEVVLDIVAQLGMLLGRVFERRHAINEREALNEQLVTTSRRAGMAEVASGVLHNVGNVLNSITVSSNLLRESLEDTSIGGVSRVTELLKEHADHLCDFFANDERSRKIIPYLEELARQLKKEHITFREELESLLSNVSHVKNIIRRQQYYAKPTTVRESVQLNDLIEDALKMNNLHSSGHRIRVKREFAELPLTVLDKHDTIQILNNLLDNAKHALDSNTAAPQITITTKLSDDKKSIELHIHDNGCGIPLETQERIFQFGFTTRENGHGIGLHTSATTAQNMGGRLHFFSDGVGQGAVFTLILPLETEISGKGEIAA